MGWNIFAPEVPRSYKGLKKLIIEKEGKVSAEIANKFLQKAGMADGISFEEAEKRMHAELASLGEETLTSLYEATAAAKYDTPQYQKNYTPPSAEYIGAMHDVMRTQGLTAEFESKMEDLTRYAYGSKGYRIKELMWQQTGMQEKYGISFEQAQDTLLINNPSLQDPMAQDFLKVDASTNNALAAHKAEFLMDMKPEDFSNFGGLRFFYDENNRLGGFQNTENGTAYVNMNVNSGENSSFAQAMGTNYHEMIHVFQDAGAQALKAGKIPEGHDLEKSFRIYEANNQAYQRVEAQSIPANETPEAKSTRELEERRSYERYVNQPLETPAWKMGNLVANSMEKRRSDLLEIIAHAKKSQEKSMKPTPEELKKQGALSVEFKDDACSRPSLKVAAKNAPALAA